MSIFRTSTAPHHTAPTAQQQLAKYNADRINADKDALTIRTETSYSGFNVHEWTEGTDSLRDAEAINNAQTSALTAYDKPAKQTSADDILDSIRANKFLSNGGAE